MKRVDPDQLYKSEADMCAQFADYARKNAWTAYAETHGWDLLLARKDGYQIGVQAKLSMNAKVLTQALENRYSADGPDYRAVLVPATSGQVGLFSEIAEQLGITIIAARGPGEVQKNGNVRRGNSTGPAFSPRLPNESDPHDLTNRDWHERCPDRRCKLPEYVPDVVAGASGPLQLTRWKIQAMKIAIILERRGFVLRSDFKFIGIDHRRWTNGWLLAGKQSWVASQFMPNFKGQHPRNYGEIAADWEKWAPKDDVPALLEAVR